MNKINSISQVKNVICDTAHVTLFGVIEKIPLVHNASIEAIPITIVNKN